MRKILLKILYIFTSVLSVFVLLIIIFNALLSIFLISETTLNKSEIKRLFDNCNEEYSLNLPTSFKKVDTYCEVHQDHFYDLVIVKVDDDYKLEYVNQVVTDRHEKFNFRQHFYYISELDDDINEISKTLSSDFDWYAYEKWNDEGTRVEYLIVVRDNVTDYLYVYKAVEQIPFC